MVNPSDSLWWLAGYKPRHPFRVFKCYTSKTGRAALLSTVHRPRQPRHLGRADGHEPVAEPVDRVAEQREEALRAGLVHPAERLQVAVGVNVI